MVIILILSACSKPPAAAGVEGETKPVVKTSPDVKLEIAAVRWVTHASSTYNQVFWKDNDEDRGLVVVLKKSRAADLTIHSNDYVLAFESDSDIPRRSCLGISYGMKSADEEISWAVIGSLSRNWNKPDQPYFALLFPAPKTVNRFSILRTAPLLTGIKAPAEAAVPASK